MSSHALIIEPSSIRTRSQTQKIRTHLRISAPRSSDSSSFSTTNSKKQEIWMPNFDGRIIQWFKKAGDRVNVGEPILRVESLKAIGSNGYPISTDIMASKNGYIAARYKLEEEIADSRSVLAVIVPDEASLNSFDASSIVTPSQSKKSWWASPYQPNRDDPFTVESTLGMSNSDISPNLQSRPSPNQSVSSIRPTERMRTSASSRPRPYGQEPVKSSSDFGNSSSLPSRSLGSIRVSGGESALPKKSTFSSDILNSFDGDYSSASPPPPPSQAAYSYEERNDSSINFSGEDFLSYLESRGLNDNPSFTSDKTIPKPGTSDSISADRRRSLSSMPRRKNLRMSNQQYDSSPASPRMTPRRRRKTEIIYKEDGSRKRRKPNGFDVAATSIGGTVWGSSLGLGARLAEPYVDPSIGKNLEMVNNSVSPAILGILLGVFGFVGSKADNDLGYSVRHVLGFGNGVKSTLYDFVSWTQQTVEKASQNILTFVSTGTSEAPLRMHHITIKTRDIIESIDFYSLFGFEPSTKFQVERARAAWLDNNVIGAGRIELIEVPSYVLQGERSSEKPPPKALDRIQNQELLGLNHLTLDVSDFIRQKRLSSLSEFLGYLNEESFNTFGKGLRLAVEPKKQTIRDRVYECAFLYDPDGSLIELQYATNDFASDRREWRK